MVDADDVRRVAQSLPEVVEIDSDGFDFRVGDRGFIWSYPDYVRGQGRVLRTEIAVLFVGDESEKQALLLGEPDIFFTAPGYERSPLVLVRLEQVGADRLTELVTDAWHLRAPRSWGLEHPVAGREEPAVSGSPSTRRRSRAPSSTSPPR